MAYTFPKGAQTPVDEPVKLPPANPAEEAELNAYMIANHLMQWKYTARCLYATNADGTAKIVTVNGIDIGMINARVKGVFGAWPMPPDYSSTEWPKTPPSNCVTVLQYPT